MNPLEYWIKLGSGPGAGGTPSIAAITWLHAIWVSLNYHPCFFTLWLWAAGFSLGTQPPPLCSRDSQPGFLPLCAPWGDMTELWRSTRPHLLHVSLEEEPGRPFPSQQPGFPQHCTGAAPWRGRHTARKGKMAGTPEPVCSAVSDWFREVRPRTWHHQQKGEKVLILLLAKFRKYSAGKLASRHTFTWCGWKGNSLFWERVLTGIRRGFLSWLTVRWVPQAQHCHQARGGVVPSVLSSLTASPPAPGAGWVPQYTDRKLSHSAQRSAVTVVRLWRARSVRSGWGPWVCWAQSRGAEGRPQQLQLLTGSGGQRWAPLPELEETPKDHWVQPDVPHSTTQTHCLGAVSQCSVSSGSSGPCPLPWAGCSMPPTLWSRAFP